MKTRLAFAIVALSLLAFAPRADARKLTKADKTLVDKTMKHIGAFAKIVKEGADKDKPKKALAKLDAEVDKRLPALKKLADKMKKIEKELDADAKKELDSYAQSKPELKAFIDAMMAFGQKYGSDKALMEQFQKTMSKLQALG